MKIAIFGAGQVGQSLVHHLSPDYEMVVIDTQQLVLDKIQSKYDIQVIRGSAANPNILKKAMIQEDTVVVAVTGSDEINLLSCQIAGSLFGAYFKAARLRNEYYFREEWQEDLKKITGIDYLFSPERDAADAILNSFEFPHTFDAFPFASEMLMLLGIQIEEKSDLVHQSVEQIYHHLSGFNVKIVRIIRNYQAIMPKEHSKIKAHDALYFIAPKNESRSIMKALGYSQHRNHSLVIFGASLVSSYTLQKLKDHRIILVDEDDKKIKKLAVEAPEVLFLKGHPLSDELLLEANIREAGYAIAATSDDAINILIALMAHSHGVKHSIALIQHSGYFFPLFALGIEKMVYPSQWVIAQLLQKLTKGHINVLYPLEGEYSGTVIEVVIQETSKAMGLSTSYLDRYGIHSLVVLRGQELIWEDVVLAPEDRLVLTVLPEGYREVQRLFETF